ncbi:MAG TPA: sigma-54 dependent transcriptional regulator [Spirochaetia bacterium]|nr:sigma-54 dependent transcriptional regulator [Spirochaetia bacterium]
MGKVLVIDDEPGIRTVLTDILEDEAHEVYAAADGFEGLAMMKQEAYEVVILDVWLPNMGGMDVLKELKSEYPEVEVIIISGHANIDLAVRAVKLGAYDFLEKPLSLEKVTTLVRNALTLEDLKRENKTLKSSLFMEDELVGESKAMLAVKELVRQSATSEAKILILGDNGTGKELVAREIHRQSKRSAGAFVEVNCAAIPDSLIESELFGHEKGSFTGAVARRKGKFELANGGTLFLDEIADLSASAQAKVLRAIQEMKFERVGSEQSISVDVRVISATNKDLQSEVQARRFREDLYFRLNVIPIHVPPLRERPEDIVALIEYFMRKFKEPDLPEPKRVSEEGLEVLLNHSWPGNVRELKNFVERINIMADEKEISLEIVKFYLGEEQTNSEPEALRAFKDMKLGEAKDEFERQFIIHKLEMHDYNITQTAQTLGVYPSNLHGKIKKYGISVRK